MWALVSLHLSGSTYGYCKCRELLSSRGWSEISMGDVKLATYEKCKRELILQTFCYDDDTLTYGWRREEGRDRGSWSFLW